MLHKFTSYRSDLHICVVTTLIMYLACTKYIHGDNKALFFSALSQFLEEQFVGDCVTNKNIRRYNYFERDLLEHVMIGYLDYMSMTVGNQAGHVPSIFASVVRLSETGDIVDRSLVFSLYCAI